MPSTKPIVFISHISEEKELAKLLKNLIEDNFLGMIEVFVSSSPDSIPTGQKWLDNITAALKTCKIEIILCSPKSVQRPWINFEAGAGWVREIPVIPVCHSGMRPSNLPMPLNLLQAVEANQISGLKLIFPVLANALGAEVPQPDFTQFVEQTAKLEKEYTFWDKCNLAFSYINEHSPEIINRLKAGKKISLGLREVEIYDLENKTLFLKENKILNFSRDGTVVIDDNGIVNGCIFTPLENLEKTMSSEEFQIS